MKVAVYTIALNEEKHVERFMLGLKNEVSDVYVTDTGSTDKTVQALRDHGVKVTTSSVKPWRFDTPRNISLSYVPADVDICVCIDLDEVFDPGWRTAIETAWVPGTTRLRYQYAWNHNPDGSCGVSFWYDKIHQRKNYRWVKPVHEVLQIYNEAEVQTYANGMKLHHWPDDSKSRGSYLPLLELAVKEEPNDDRSSHYLGREYMYYELHEKAIAELERHLSLSTALWKAERAASMRFIARCNTGLGRHNEAQAWALKSCVEAPSDREPWYDLAIAAYKAPKQDWHMIRLACNKALEIETRPASYICEQAAWGHELWDYLALASWNLGDKAGAIAAGAKALELNPTDIRLATNLAYYQG